MNRIGKIIFILLFGVILSGCENERDRFLSHLDFDLGFKCEEFNCYSTNEHESRGQGAIIDTIIEENINLINNTYSMSSSYNVVKNNKSSSINSYNVSFNYDDKNCLGKRIIENSEFDYDNKEQTLIKYKKSKKIEKYNCKKTKNSDSKEICEFLRDKCLELKNNFVSISRGYDIEEVINISKR